MACVLSAAANAEPTPVAIVIEPRSAAAPDAVTQARATLASDPAVKLVEPVDDKPPSAKVLVVVQPSTDGRTIDGLIVFDSATGVRLEDSAVTADPREAADVLVSRIRSAVAKSNLPADRRRPVCIVAVRNADLPSELAALPQAAGRLLERRLTNSSSVVLLERTRLDRSTAIRPAL